MYARLADFLTKHIDNGWFCKQNLFPPNKNKQVKFIKFVFVRRVIIEKNLEMFKQKPKYFLC